MPLSEPSKEVIRFYRSQDLPGVELLSAEHSDRLWKAFHETYVVCVNQSGNYNHWTYRGKSFQCVPGGSMLMEPGEIHATRAVSAPSAFKVFFFSAPTMEQAAREYGLGKLPHLKVAQSFDPDIYRMFSGLGRCMEDQGSALELQSRVAACCGMLMGRAVEDARSPAEKPDGRAVLKARDLLRQNWAQNISLDELAAAVGLSRFHLLRAFAKRMGVPPHAYQNHLRISRARAYLKRGACSVQVAQETGFSDQSHFIRQFKRDIGVTPAQYQAAVR